MGIEDKLNQAKGALKEGAGKLTGDKRLKSKVLLKKVVAKAKDGIEDVKEGVEGAVEGLKMLFLKIIINKQKLFSFLKRASVFLYVLN